MYAFDVFVEPSKSHFGDEIIEVFVGFADADSGAKEWAVPVDKFGFCLFGEIKKAHIGCKIRLSDFIFQH